MTLQQAKAFLRETAETVDWALHPDTDFSQYFNTVSNRPVYSKVQAKENNVKMLQAKHVFTSIGLDIYQHCLMLQEAPPLTKFSQRNLMTLENFIDWFTTDENQRAEMKCAAYDYIREDHTDGEDSEEAQSERKGLTPEYAALETLKQTGWRLESAASTADVQQALDDYNEDQETNIQMSDATAREILAGIYDNYDFSGHQEMIQDAVITYIKENNLQTTPSPKGRPLK